MILLWNNLKQLGFPRNQWSTFYRSHFRPHRPDFTLKDRSRDMMKAQTPDSDIPVVLWCLIQCSKQQNTCSDFRAGESVFEKILVENFRSNHWISPYLNSKQSMFGVRWTHRQIRAWSAYQTVRVRPKFPDFSWTWSWSGPRLTRNSFQFWFWKNWVYI